MLESLTIHNFQKHGNLKVDFDPKITVIRGETDSGKSAIYRAFRWVALNKPRGDSFIKRGEKETQVTLKVDGVQITRIRGPKNLYRLEKPGEKPRDFVSFGNEVPSEIAEILQTSDMNFQGQHDPAFWFSKTAGDVSRELNAIVDLEIIDTTLKNLSTKQRRVKQEAGIIESRLRDARKQRKGLRFVEEMTSDMEALEETQQDLSENIIAASLIDKLLSTYSEGRGKHESALDTLKTGQRALSLGDEMRTMGDEFERISKYIAEISRYHLKATVKLPSPKCAGVAINELDRCEDDIKVLSHLLSLHATSQGERENAQGRHEILSRDLKKLQKGRCPLCGK